MSDIRQPPSLPRGTLFGAGTMIALALLAAGVSRITGPVSTMPLSAPLAERDLLFQDRTDGGVRVLDARTDRTLEIIAPGTNGFLRATLRGLARERYHEDIGAETPFRLTGYTNGRLTLEDPTTHRQVELEAFGHTNAEVFARLLPLPGEREAREKAAGEKTP